MFNSTKSKLLIKNFRVTLLQQILNANHVDLMSEAWYGREYVSFFTIWIVQSVVTCESGRTPSCKSLYFGISKRILYFPYYFHVPCTVLFTVYFHTAISMFRFFCYWSHSNANTVNQTIQKLQRLKRKSNIPWVTCYTLNYKIVALLSLRSILKEVLLKIYINQLKDVCNEVHIFDKIAGWGLQSD